MDALQPLIELTTTRKGPIGATFVEIDAETGLRWQRGFFGAIVAHRKIWRVIPDRQLLLPIDQITLPLRSEGRSVEIRFSCDVSIAPTEDVAVVEALCRDDRPATALKNWIRGWFARWSEGDGGGRSRAEIEERLRLDRGDLERRLEDAAARELHLRLRVHLDLPTSPTSDLPLDTGVFRVRPHDVQAEHSVSLALTLVRGATSIRPGGPTTSAEWIEHIVAIAKQAFDRSITLHDMMFDVETASRTLRDAIDAHVGRYGKTVTRFVPTFPKANAPRETTVQAKVPWKSLSDRVVDMMLTVNMSIDPKNYGRYEAAGRPDLAAWVRAQVPAILENQLFRLDYIDLEPPVLEQLRSRLQRDLGIEAATIGHLVRTVVSEPDLPELQWRRGVRLVCPAREYATKAPAFKADIDIDVAVIAEHLRLLKPYFDRKVDVAETVRKATTDAAEAFFRSIDPVDYIQNFHPVETEGGGAAVAVRSVFDRLRAAIADHLLKYYGLQITAFVASRHDRWINEIIDDLINVGVTKTRFQIGMGQGMTASRLILPGEVEFYVKSTCAGDSILAVLSGRFTIERVAGAIRAIVEEWALRLDPREIEAIVNDPDLSARTAHTALRANLIRKIREEMAEKFGLEIEVSALRIDDTEERRKKAWDIEAKSVDERAEHHARRRASLIDELNALEDDKVSYRQRRAEAYRLGDSTELRALEVFKRDIDAREEELRQRGGATALPPSTAGRDVAPKEAPPSPPVDDL